MKVSCCQYPRCALLISRCILFCTNPFVCQAPFLNSKANLIPLVCRGEGLKQSRQCSSTVTTCFTAQHYGPRSDKINLISNQSVIKHGNEISFASSIQHHYCWLRLWMQQYNVFNAWAFVLPAIQNERGKDVTPLIIMVRHALNWRGVILLKADCWSHIIDDYVKIKRPRDALVIYIYIYFLY